MKVESKSSGTRVLVVEDNPVDVRLLRYALEKQREWPTEMTVAEDGEKAIHLLEQSVSRATRPDFVILDLNLPKRDGTEVLRWIRSTEGLRSLRVAVVSSSPVDVSRDKMSGAKVEADCYFVKPMDVESFIGLAKQLHSWFEQGMRQ
jgi:two-component system, chemotaxis family, response regulator Rcp1